MQFMKEKYLLKSETALSLYSKVRDLPIIDPHNHADVAEIAANLNYPNPWQVFAATDHYVWEVMRKRGVKEEFITGKATPKEKWMELARIFPEIVGNPVYEWIHLDLRRRFGIEQILDASTGSQIWDKVDEALKKPEFRPLDLLKTMNVETFCSTDDPADTLEFHAKVNGTVGKTFVRPTWRPDKATRIWQKTWKEYILKLGKRWNTEITSVKILLDVLKKSHDFFAEAGCRASDHDTPFLCSGDATLEQAEAIFRKGIRGETVGDADYRIFCDYLTLNFAKWDSEKDWVYQMHIGVRRDVRDSIFNTIGPDAGGDVSDHEVDIVRPLCKFLNHFDNSLKVVLYCLEPGHQASLATIARAFGEKVRLGSAWWLCDTPIGMRRQLEYIGSVDLLWDFAGMVSDSRKILSYASRFEMFRRVASNVVAEAVELGQIPYVLAEKLIVRMCYEAPKEFYNV